MTIKGKVLINMDISKLNGKVADAMLNSGWDKNRKHYADEAIDCLVEMGFELNEYAEEILKELGGINFKFRENDVTENRFFYCDIAFDPVSFAENDRIGPCYVFAKETMFPIGGMHDYTVYAGESHKIYLADWKNIAIVGNDIEDFLNNMCDRNYVINEYSL